MTPTIFPEVAAAAKWWADQLRHKPVHDNGDVMGSMLATLAAANLAPISDEQIAAFESALASHLQAACEKHWHSDDPIRGGVYRTTATDYAPEGVLVDALQDAGIADGDLRLPIKTVVWIDPGKVDVACGYGAKPVRIYPAGNGGAA